MTWTNGRHAYHGLRNSKSKRLASKIMQGIDIRQLGEAYSVLKMENLKKIDKEKKYEKSN